jgi:hypothetical protein
VVCASCISLLVLACRTTNESRLVGTYRVDASCVTVSLVVNQDHSFVQRVETRDGETNRLTGKWSVDKKNGYIDFEPFLDFLNDAHGRQLGFASYPPEIIGTVIEIGPVILKCPDSDHELYYARR